GIFCSCRKVSVVQNTTEPKWIKVIADSVVHFPGKIRADAQNNLYCSYNYNDAEISGTSAIVKLDTNGNIVWRTVFTNTSIFDFITTQSGLVIASYLSGIITVTTSSYEGTDTFSNS